MFLPAGFNKADVLYITATDPFGREIYTWSWPVKSPQTISDELISEEWQGKIRVSDDDVSLTAQINDLVCKWDKRTGFLTGIKNKDRLIRFNHGPVPATGSAEFQEMKSYYYDSNYVIECIYKGALKKVKWTLLTSGWLKLEVTYKAPNPNKFMGISFDYPEEEVKGIRWMGNGPYRVWKNRMKGTTLNVWEKAYNNTITGESGWIYPEFKGYFSNFYWATLQSKEQNFTVVCPDDDVFLRMYTPEKPVGATNDNTSPEFPAGNISFLHAIDPIGTKFKKPEQLGPMSQPNMFLYEKNLTLFFNFN